MTKVIIPKEVAEAIETVLKDKEPVCKHIYMTNWDKIASRNSHEVYRTLVDFAKVSPLTYMNALVYGYEVEKTKEEKVKEYFDTQAFTMNEDNTQHAIIKVLNILEYKIKGVNA